MEFTPQTLYDYYLHLDFGPKLSTDIDLPINQYTYSDTEILFTITNDDKVLEQGEDLMVHFFTNKKLDKKSRYILTIQ
jgi:hypothetical protein